MNNLIIIIIYNFLIISIYSEEISPCLSEQECYLIDSNNTIKCSSHGKCFYDLFKYILNDTKNFSLTGCICDEGYTDLNSDSTTKCCYKQKKQSNAFLLELLSFGIGHLYIGNKVFFYLKLFIECICIVLNIIISFRIKIINSKLYDYDGCEEYYEVNKRGIILNIVMFIFNSFMILFHLIDLILFGLNFYKDKNGVKLKSW